MTDNEIINELNLRIDNFSRETLDLINRLKMKNKELDERNVIYRGTVEWQAKEIKRQKVEVERLQKNIDGLNIFKKNHTKVIRLQAIKEFVERLKEKLQWDVEFDNKLVFESDIDNLVKEMTEVETNQRKEDEGK